MNRRTFLRRVLAGVVGLTLARELPGIATAAPTLVAPGVGITVRFLRHFDVADEVFRCRIDVAYLVATWNPDFAVRVQSE